MKKILLVEDNNSIILGLEYSITKNKRDTLNILDNVEKY